jgi:NCS1 family nucleobase:cation symporter-1
MPWELYRNAASYIFTWLIGYSGLMGAIGGILICDYWVVRKRRLLLAHLFREKGVYSYRNGFNWRAIAALVLGIAPVAPGFLRAAVNPNRVIANPDFFDTMYTYAWFVTFGLSFSIYLLLTRLRPPVTEAGD